MGASPKGTVTLSDGQEITVDVSTLKIREWRSFWNAKSDPDEDDKVIARLAGLTVEQLQDLLRDDYRRVFEKIMSLSNRPLDDSKNSPSAST